MWKRLASWSKTMTAQYALFGALFGLLFPLGGMVIDIIIRGWEFTPQAFLDTHRQSPIFWLIDTVPILLGYLASIIGRREDRLAHLTAQLEEQIDERTDDFLRQYQLFEALFHNNPLPIVTVDVHQKIVATNPAFETMFGYTQAEVIDTDLDKLITTEETYSEAYALTIRSAAGDTIKGSGARKKKDGTMVDVEIYAVPVRVGDEQLGVFAIYNDVTERKHAEDVLKESEARYRSLFEDSPISLWEEDFSAVKQYLDELREKGIANLRTYFDRNPDELTKCVAMIQVTNVNEATLRLYKATSKDELKSGLSQVLGNESRDVFKEELIALIEGAQHYEAEIAQRTMEGKRIVGHVQLTIAPDSRDTWDKVYVSVIDITERQALEAKLRETLSQTESLARTDALTGSLNRRAIMEQARAELARAERERTSLGLALVDMDFLKETNDKHGHLVGDDVLRLLASTLEKACRLYDKVGRWGGDEFMIVLPNIDHLSAQAIAERLLVRVNEATLSLTDGQEIRLSVCIGVSAIPPGDGEGMELEELLRQADSALLQAKQTGRNAVRTYAEAGVESEQAESS